MLLLLLLLSGVTYAQAPTYTNSVGMEFIRIDTGRMIVGRFQPPYPVPDDTVRGMTRPMVMWMGDGRPYSAKEFALARSMAERDAMPGFEVVISKPFYIARFEVTQEVWQRVMGTNPSVFQGGEIGDTSQHPVENVTWEDVQEFLRLLNQVENTTRYRLPTEFEWEYAARAGAEGDIPWSETQRVAQLGGKTTRPVGQKEPNAWGLYDMLGNVWEWVDDFYNEKIFADPVPPATGKLHVLKGASFVGDVKNATWFTHAGGPGNGWDVGFRVVMEIEEE
jgi:sulfatase modifying factor 1